MAKIMIIDNNNLVRRVIGPEIQELGHKVQFVDHLSFYDILKAVRESMPSLVILDCLLPCCNSETLVRALREDPSLKGLKVLAFSAQHDAETVEHMLDRGVDGFVFKGHTATLITRIQELIN